MSLYTKLERSNYVLLILPYWAPLCKPSGKPKTIAASLATSKSPHNHLTIERLKMIYYTLNTIGQAAVTKEILEICSKKQNIYPDAFFEDAENARNDIYGSGGQAFEICWTLTDSRNPVVVDVQPEWFDEQILED